MTKTQHIQKQPKVKEISIYLYDNEQCQIIRYPKYKPKSLQRTKTEIRKQIEMLANMKSKSFKEDLANWIENEANSLGSDEIHLEKLMDLRKKQIDSLERVCESIESYSVHIEGKYRFFKALGQIMAESLQKNAKTRPKQKKRQ